MNGAGGYPSSKLVRYQEPGMFAFHLHRALEGIEQLVHIVDMPRAINLHTRAEVGSRPRRSARPGHFH